MKGLPVFIIFSWLWYLLIKIVILVVGFDENEVISMAQSSNALREPTTDEILTSIREIIEENTGRANWRPAEQNANVNNDSFAVSKPSISNSSATQQSMPQSSTFDEPLAQPVLTVDDAMQALAARIGLKEEIDSKNSDIKNSFTEVAKQDVGMKQESEAYDIFGHISEADHFAEVHPIYPNQNDDVSARLNLKTSMATSSAIRSENAKLTDGISMDSEFYSNVNAMAEAAVRPIVLKWLENHWPSLVEKILREEITKAFMQNFPSSPE